jgi:hypothetical protein
MAETHAEPLPPVDPPAQAKRVDFEVVRPAYKPRGNPRGQTRRLTLRAFIRIAHLIEQGWAITKACESESITNSLFRLRCSENPRLERRIKEATAVRFQRRHEEAVESVMRAGEKDWTAHAWWLERNLPQLYSLKSVDRSEVERDLRSIAPVIRVLILPDADFEQISGNPNYAVLPNGSLERIEGSLRIRNRSEIGKPKFAYRMKDGLCTCN